MNYQIADEKLQGRNKNSRKIGNNTYLERRPDGSIVIRLHNTDILTFNPNGDTTLEAGGWHTVTTKARINEFMSTGWGLYQKNFDWYLQNYITGQEIDYRDGITITSEGRIIGIKS